MRHRPEVQIAVDWATRCFGWPHVANRKERALRLVEEAIELCQACQVEQKDVSTVLDSVYARPHGDVMQEMGGVLMTAYVMSVSILGSDPDELFSRELLRVLDKDPREFAARNKEKIAIPEVVR